MILRFTFCLFISILSSQTFGLGKTLVIYGDSISAAYGVDPSKGWVNLLKKHLANHTEEISIINASVSGETTKGGLSRISNVLKDHQPDILVLELGGNDGLRGYPISVILSNLDAIISTSSKSDTEVMLIGMVIPPNYGEKYTKAFTGIFFQLASKHQLPFVPVNLDDTLTNKTLLQSDGIHPNEKGHRLIFEKVFSVLEPIL